jgi:hypothetical protein
MPRHAAMPCWLIFYFSWLPFSLRDTAAAISFAAFAAIFRRHFHFAIIIFRHCCHFRYQPPTLSAFIFFQLPPLTLSLFSDAATLHYA